MPHLPPSLETRRLRLRPWTPEDREPFAALNADPAVTAFLGGALTRAQSDNVADAIECHFAAHGFGLWAVEVTDGARFVGFTGLNTPAFEAAFTPCVEAAWRLAKSAWGKGYATEAARAALAFGFETAGLDEIIAYTAAENRRSHAVMVRLGMRRDARDDFDHPNLPQGHPLRRHILTRLTRQEWQTARREC